VALHREGFVIDCGILVGHLARQQHKHRLEDFMADSDDRPLGPPNALRPTRESALSGRQDNVVAQAGQKSRRGCINILIEQQFHTDAAVR
jgi:hypothetical protein